MGHCSKPDITQLIERHDWNALRETVAKLRVPDIADLLLDLDKADRILLFRSLPRTLAAEVFSYLDRPAQDLLLRQLTDEETRHLMANLSPDDRTALLEELPGEITQKLLNLLSPEELKEARQLLGYPEESIGRLMTPDYVAVRPDWTVSQTMEHIRKMARGSETINVIYVTDRNWKLLGVLTLRQVALAKPDTRVGDIMTAPAISLCAFSDREEAARVMDKYGLFVLPVVDTDGVLLGIVTGDDVFDVASEEATEDFHKGAAVTPLKVRYADAPVGLLFRSRIGWLLALVFVDLISAGVISRFESVISKVVSLVYFLPLLIGCGGNAGCQSSTLVIRELALGEIRPGDSIRLFLKELAISTLLGLTISLVVFGPSLLQGGYRVAAVVSMGAVIIVSTSSIIGLALPFIMNRFGQDPAASSSPLITSIADIFGVIVYFTLASLCLNL